MAMEREGLSRDELIRYQRQIIIPEFGEQGQRRLKTSHVLIAGIGGLGCASATYLTAAGIGKLTIVDFDKVELSDLNRQVLYCKEDIGKKKVLVAQRRLSKLNPNVEIVPQYIRITESNIHALMEGVEVVVDGLDNPETRLLVNSACVKYKIPFVYGGVSRLRGMITTIIPGKTPCLSCFYPEGPQGERGLGVLGPIPSLIANLQVLEVIKILIGEETSFSGRLLSFNGNDMQFRFYEIRRNENCRVCSGAG